MFRPFLLLGALFVALALPGVAFAHTGLHAGFGFQSGFAHPWLGVDHLLAMVAVGVWGAFMGGRARVILPATFVTGAALGGLIGFAGIQGAGVEAMIAVSVVVFGLLIAIDRKLPLAAAMAITGGFALFHGVAHGAEIPAGASALTYGTGFLAATALLHAAGVMLASLPSARLRRFAQIAGGGAIAAVGLGLVAGIV